MERMKKCPFCGEEILDVAIKCKHCGSDLVDNGMSRSKVTEGNDYGLFLVAIPLIGTFLVWFWIGSMNMFQSPSSSLALVMLGVVFGTAYFSYKEISRQNSSLHSELSKSGALSAVKWAVLIVLFWLVSFPVYLKKRNIYPVKSRFVLGLVAVIIFAASAFTMESWISAKVESLRQPFSADGIGR